MTPEAPLTPMELLELLIEQGANSLAIENQRRLCGLPATERPEPKIVIRPVVAVSAPRPRRRSSRKATTAKKTTTPATSTARVETRFDLSEIYEND